MGLREEQRVQKLRTLSEERFKLKMAQVDTPPAFRHGGVSNICFLVDVPS